MFLWLTVLTKRTRKSMQVNTSWQNQNLRAQVHASKKSHRHFPHIQLTCDQLVSTFVGWTNGETLASTWVRTNLSSIKVNASPVHASRWPNETYVQRKFKTRVDLPTVWPKHHGLSARVSVQLSRCHKPTSSPLG